MPSMANPVWAATHHHGDCLGFFLEYQKCYVQADVPEKECELWRQDYVECKMHLREVALFTALHHDMLI